MNVTQYRYKGEALIMRTLPLEAVVAGLKTEVAVKPVSAMRQQLVSILPGRPSALVQRLPILVFSATYRRKESQPLLNKYTGRILLEVNGLIDLQEATRIRNEAAEMPQTLLAFVGSSGRSVKIVVPFTLPDGSLPTRTDKIKLFHTVAYASAIKHYQPQLSSMLALKEPLLTRGCRMSFDPETYYNPEAVAIRLDQPVKMPDEGALRLIQDPPADPLERLMPGLARNTRIAHLFSLTFWEAFRKSGQSCTATCWTPLLVDLAQNCCQSGIPEEEAVGWTLRYTQLQKHDTEVRMTFRTAYAMKQLGEDRLCLPHPTQLTMLLEEFMGRRYYLQINEMTGETEYLDRSMIQFAYQPYTPKVRNSMCLEARREGLDVWDKDIDRYACSNQQISYHPIESFIKELPVWNGKDHIRALANRITCSNAAWSDLFYRWFLSMVAHWLQLDKEHGNSTTPLLVGDQGCGKSTFCLHLLPPALRNYYTDSIDFSKRRDAELALHRYALINIDEFDSVRPSHQSLLKHILQKASVNTRLPYRTTNQNLRRYATFIATSNNFDLLTDPTGSRRFICVEVEGRIDYNQPIDYEQLYAQAKEALAADERFWFTPEEEALVTQNNQRFQQLPVEEQLFLQYFTPAPDTESGKSMLAVEILAYIASKQASFKLTKGIIRNFGKLLSRNKVPNKRSARGTKYYVIESND